MAQPSMPSMAESTPPRVHELELDDFNAPEDPNEWEYEYSTTETETYYVTLDLTLPDHKHKLRSGGSDQRKTLKGRWLKPNIDEERRKAPDENDTPAASPRLDVEDVDDDSPDTPDVRNRAEGSGQNADEGGPSNVQILGLHSKNPIVAYNGTVYSCQWADNLGTELLFTAHDPDSTLPVLRHLHGHVDLLAASSARIISNAVHIEPKPHTDLPKRNRHVMIRDPAFQIPVGVQASSKRKAQARFLERLIGIKEDRGDEDEVTVTTMKKFTRANWRSHLAQRRNQERKKLQNVVKKITSRFGVQKAVERLAELDREDEKAKEVQERWMAESRVHGTSRTRIRGRGHGARGREMRLDRDATPGSGDGTPYRDTGSVLTPRRWEIEDSGHDDDEDLEDSEDSDENMAEGMFYDEDAYGDEDANGQDEEADEDGQFEYE